MILRYCALKFIPVRGRKPVVACIPRLADGLKFIPERGRKLHGGREKIQLHSGDPLLKFIPVRGRKHLKRKHFQVKNIEIYPCEGMETVRSATIYVRVYVEIYPREGTETRVRLRPGQDFAWS